MKENLFSSKLFTLLLVSLLAINSVSAQINFSQNFNGGSSLPTGWIQSGNYINSNTNSCDGRTPRALLSSGSNWLRSPVSASNSNGLAINVSFIYKVLNSSGGTAALSNFGSIDVQYAVNGSSTFTTAYTINSSNHVSSTNCATVNFTIPSGTIPNANSIQLRFFVTHANGSFYTHFDDVVVSQNTAIPPNCNSTLTTPSNGASNVPVSTSSLVWSAATGSPTGYLLRVGTTPGASDLINNVDVGNVTTYPITLNYSTTYYVGITPYNANGNATSCSEYIFTTVAPVTTTIPWSEEFLNTSPPNEWTTTGFTISNSIRLPDNTSNIIFKNLNSGNTTGNFSTISVGEIQSGDKLNFIYRLANSTPAPYNPPAAGSGNFVVSISTDYGINYTNVETVTNDGTAGWQNFAMDLSSYAGEFIKIKITVNRTSGDYFIGFDDFYIGQQITCPLPEDLILNYAADNSAQISWEAVANAPGYNWFVFTSGANPNTSSPLFSGSVSTATALISGLTGNTGYDFYVEADCGTTDGLSELSEVLSFSTQCDTINNFPFTETFENDSTSRNCWNTEYVTGTTNWFINTGAAGGSITTAHSGTYNALFFFASYAANITKLVSPLLDVADMTAPKLTFWYANQEGFESGDQNELRIYYKNELGGAWTLIPGATYTSNISEWTYIELDLPAVSENYLIAFEGTNKYGEGIVLDDVTVIDFDACPVTTWDGLAWSNGVPDLNKKAVIDGAFIVDSNLEACELEITSSGSLEIPSGMTFTVNGLITNNSTVDNFVVASGANLIQIENTDNIGGITVFRDSQPFKRLEYTIWSSPVEGQELQGFSPATLPNRILTYNGASEYVPVPSATENFSEAKGYMFRAPNTWNSTVTTVYPGKFIGVPFNGSVSISTYADNFTSIGNPYPSNIDADDLFAANPGIISLYFWTNVNPVSGSTYSGNNYAAYTLLGGTSADGGGSEPNGIIAVGQGFIVATEDTSVDFDNTMRSTSESIFFKEEMVNERHRFWLAFKFKNPLPDNPDNFSSLNGNLLGYMTGATNGFDSGIDAKLFGYAGSALYSIIEGSNEKYTTQGRALPFEISDIIPMGIRIINSGEFSITLTQMDGLFAEGQDIYLRDKYLNTVNDLKQESYTFTSEPGEFNDRFEIIYVNNECPSATIWDGFTWSNGLPDLNKKAIIDGDFILNNDLEACQLEVTANGNFEIPSGFTFTVNGMISNFAEATNFIVASGGNLIQNEDVENLGEIKVVRESQPMVRLDYTMWSSPVANQNLFGFSPETVNGVTNYIGSTGRIYIYDGTSGYINPNPFTAEAVMNEGTGYLFRSPNNWDANVNTTFVGEFIGIANNGNLSITTNPDNFTSIGNPYPSNINADALLENNLGITAIYYWNNTGLSGNNYATYTNLGGTAAGGGSVIPDEFISVGQGFIVSTVDASVNFDNSMRIGDPAHFFKINETEKHRIWLNLSNSENQRYNQMLVGYMPGATNGIDNQIDGKLFRYEGSALYNIINESKFSIQGRSLPFDSSDVVALGFKAVEAGKFVISLDNFDGLFAESEVKIYLKDNQNNTLHNLMEDDYTFESAAGEFKSRFEIVYETEEILGSDDMTSNLVQIYTYNDQILVSSKSEKILSVELFDMVGRNIFRSEKINSNQYEFKSYSKGVLVVRVQTQNGEIITKRVMNK